MREIADEILRALHVIDRGIDVPIVAERRRVGVGVVPDPVPFGDGALRVRAQRGIGQLLPENEERALDAVLGEKIEDPRSRLRGSVVEGKGEVRARALLCR
jgi:hypothetical protein